MIAIWDNGHEWSMHAVCLIALTDDAVGLRRLNYLKLPAKHDARLLGVAKEINWYGGKPMSWEEFVLARAVHEPSCEELCDGWEAVGVPDECTCWIKKEATGG